MKYDKNMIAVVVIVAVRSVSCHPFQDSKSAIGHGSRTIVWDDAAAAAAFAWN